MRKTQTVVGFAAVLAVMVVAFLAIPGAAAPFVGGGWYVGFQAFDPTGINAALRDAQLPTLPGGVVTFGGGGNGPLPIGDGNWTTGGFGAGGQAEASDGAKRSRLAVGYGGVRVGYSRSLTERVSLDAGFGVAFGGVTVVGIGGATNKMDFSQRDEVTFTRFLLALMPDAGLSLRLGPLTHLQVRVGYFFDTGLGKWRNTLGTVLTPQPSDKFSGAQVTLSLSFGPGREMLGSDMAD